MSAANSPVGSVGPVVSGPPGLEKAKLVSAVLACLDLATSVDDLSSRLVPILTEALGTDRGSLYTVDPVRMCLRSVIAQGAGHTLTIPLRIGLVGACIFSRETLVVNDAYAHPLFNSDVDAALGFQTRSLLVAPMLASSGELFGCMEVINKQTGSFTGEDREKLCAAANRIARWIETDAIYPAGVEAEAVTTRRSIGCERVSVFAVDDRSSALKALYADGDGGRLLSLNMKLGISGMVAITGKSVMLKDAWDDIRFDRSVDARTGYRTRSMLCVALRYEGQACGVIQLINRSAGDFLPEHLEALEALSTDIARTVYGLTHAAGGRV